MVEPLKRNGKIERKGPVVLVIMDGVGFGKYKEGDAVASALTGNLDKLYATCPWTKLKAHGVAVGLPSDADMGNSEVGHNAMGAGRVFAQGAKLVSNAISSGDMYKGATWQKLVKNVKDHDSTLHFIGLLSDGNVHSHIDHLKAMVAEAKKEGVKKVRVHALLDGRDVGEVSALDYFDPFAAYLAELSADGTFDAQIASGGGRMVITMDRYNADWDMVRKGWYTHVLGEGRQFASAHEAIETLRAETGAIDQDLPPFVVAKDGKPVGTVEDGDSVILFNFRGDRAIELSRAFDEKDFTAFDRKRYPSVEYAGMMEYDGDLHIPHQYLVSPPAIDRTMAEYLCSSGVKQFSISETQKFGHVTYFFNGNKSGMFDPKLEEYVEIPSDKVPFEQRPWMKCAEIADRVIAEIESGKWNFIKLRPGLVGGHCISVDPYYLIQKAQVYGVLPRVMFSARRLNDGMGDYVANQVIKCMNKKGLLVKDARILILGVTFKENCPDIRNTKVVDIYHTLREYTDNITVYDPWANQEAVTHEYGLAVTSDLPAEGRYDAVILAVAHKQFLEIDVRSLLADPEKGVVYDVKGILPREVIDGRL